MGFIPNATSVWYIINMFHILTINLSLSKCANGLIAYWHPASLFFYLDRRKFKDEEELKAVGGGLEILQNRKESIQQQKRRKKKLTMQQAAQPLSNPDSNTLESDNTQEHNFIEST